MVASGGRLPAPLLMVGAAFLFALMGVCVKFASAHYDAGEIVFYRSLVGLVLMTAVLRLRRVDWRTTVPAMHFWRSLSGATALCLWFYAIGGLPLATAITLNYMSSVWIALFLIGGADEGEICLVRNGEDDAAIFALEEIALVVIKQAAGDDVAAAHKAHAF